MQILFKRCSLALKKKKKKSKRLVVTKKVETRMEFLHLNGYRILREIVWQRWIIYNQMYRWWEINDFL